MLSRLPKGKLAFTLFAAVLSPCAASAQGKPPPGAQTSASARAPSAAEIASALAPEKAAMQAAARLLIDRARTSEAKAAIDAIGKRAAARLERPHDPAIRIAVLQALHPFTTQAAVAQGNQAMTAQLAMLRPPPPDVAQALAGEQRAIQAAAAKAPGADRSDVSVIVSRLAARTKRNANDPALTGWVIQAVQRVRVEAANAPGGSVHAAAPEFLRAALDGSVAKGFLDLSRVDGLVSEGKVDDAVQILRRNFDHTDALIAPVLMTATAAASGQLLQSLEAQVDLAQNVAKRAPEHAGAVETAFVASALRKGRGLEVERRISAGVSATSGDAARVARGVWSTTRTLIAELEFQRAYGVPPTTTQTQDLAKLRTTEETTQKQLASIAKPSRTADASFGRTTALPSLRRALPAGERLVSYVRYDTAKQSARYAGYVLDHQRLSFHELGPAGPIDASVSDYLDALDRMDGSPGSMSRKTALAQALYALVFAPLESRLAGATNVRVAADGALQLIPFAALHDSRDWLVGRLAFTYLSSERELLGSFSPATKGSPPLVVAWSPQPGAQTQLKAGKPLSPGDLPALPGVAREAQIVSKLLPQSRLLTGNRANDWTFQKLHGPSILHIAAHGLFLSGSDQPAGGRGLARVPSASAPGSSGPAASHPPAAIPAGTQHSKPGAEHVDSLVRSAIGLSPNASPPTDGFLTGYEVAATNFSGTELVVLSACETGRGASTRIEGVRGLRSAFFAAGAKSLIVSLWHVKDDTTVNLMQHFYGELARKKGRREALQSAMLAARARSADPSEWAAFALLGSTGPLVAFGAAPDTQAAVGDESAGARAARAGAFARMEAGRSNPGAGSWNFGGSTESLIDSYIEAGLGPNRNNLRINLVGRKSGISFFISGYRGPGRYRVGPSGGQAGLVLNTGPAQLDASLLHTAHQPSSIKEGEVVLSGGGSAPLAGSFILRLGRSEIRGTFTIPGGT